MQIYNEFFKNFQRNFENELSFYFKKSDLYKYPRGRDFNLLYINYCHKKLEVKMVLKCSINSKKELISLWNLTKVLRFPINFTTRIRTQH